MIAQRSPMSPSNAEQATVAGALTQATNWLQPGTDTPRLEAELLLAHALDCPRATLYAYPERRLTRRQVADYQKLLTQRAGGVPLPYLTGHVEFYGLDLAVAPAVLIPRPETETLVERALSLLSDPTPVTIADVGTGSGCIAVALATHAPHADVYALDLSPDALAVAHANVERHNVASRVRFIQSDLLTALPQPVNLIAANPPYIAAQEWPRLPREVGEHEPRLALYGGRDGLAVIRRLLDQAPAHLCPGGSLLIEIGAAQGKAATQLARRVFPTADVTLYADLAGRDRVLCVQTQRDE